MSEPNVGKLSIERAISLFGFNPANTHLVNVECIDGEVLFKFEPKEDDQ